MNDRTSPKIGVFDSGVGGLTVMSSLIRAFPKEKIIYFGDTKHLPYGNKSREKIIKYCKEACTFLLSKKIKLLVVACHTVSTCGIEEIKKHFPVPVIGMIDATLQEIKKSFQGKTIAILGTENTIKSGVYQHLIQKQFPKIELFPLACPLFVPLIEQGKKEESIMFETVKETLNELKEKKLDAVILACTHFPFIKDHIQKVLGEDVQIIDPAEAVVKEVSHQMKSSKISNFSAAQFEEKKLNLTIHDFSDYQFYLSNASSSFAALATQLLDIN